MIARQFLQNVLSHDKQMEILSALFCEYNNILNLYFKINLRVAITHTFSTVGRQLKKC